MLCINAICHIPLQIWEISNRKSGQVGLGQGNVLGRRDQILHLLIMFFLMVYILWCFDILKSLLASRDCLSQGWTSQFLANPYKPTNPMYTDPATSLSNDHTQANISSALNHPKTRYQVTRDHPYSPKPAGIIPVSQSSIAYSQQSGNPRTDSGLCFPHHSCVLPPDQDLVLPLWPCMACGGLHSLSPSAPGPVSTIHFFLPSLIFISSCGCTTLAYHLKNLCAWVSRRGAGVVGEPERREA